MEVKEFYETVGGDYQDVMNRLPTEALVVKFLKKYASGDEFGRIVEAYEAKDYRKLFEETHNVKGMTANLSLTKLCGVVTEMCEAVRHGDPEIDLEPLMEKAKEYQKLVLENIALI